MPGHISSVLFSIQKKSTFSAIEFAHLAIGLSTLFLPGYVCAMGKLIQLMQRVAGEIGAVTSSMVSMTPAYVVAGIILISTNKFLKFIIWRIRLPRIF
jgi:hypothetical protein